MKKLLLLLAIPLISYGQTPITQIGQDIDGQEADDISGGSISISGDGTIVAIGATGHDEFSGHTRIFENVNNIWTQIGDNIDAENIRDRAGSSVSLSEDGTIVAIGAITNDGGGNSSGHVRVFQNSNGNWFRMGQDIDGVSIINQEGNSVSLSNDGLTLITGAPLNSDFGMAAGQARVFEFVSNAWIQVGQNINGLAAGDGLGRNVSISGNGTIIAVGAENTDANGLVDSGQVTIYENVGGTWTQIGNPIDGEAVRDRFGASISLSDDGTVVAIGAPSSNENGDNSGHVRLFENVGGTWTQIGDSIVGEAALDNTGRSVSLSSDGTIVAIGADSNSNDNGPFSGHVRLFENVGGTWTQIGENINGESAEIGSGSSVALSNDGTVVAIGAPFSSDNDAIAAGHVRVFTTEEVEIPLSTDESLITEFSVFPNPASTNITIQLGQNNTLDQAIIYNTVGQIVKRSGDNIINISDLSTGIYILEVSTNGAQATRKLIIE